MDQRLFTLSKWFGVLGAIWLGLATMGDPMAADPKYIRGFPVVDRAGYVPKRQVPSCVERYPHLRTLGIEPSDTGRNVSEALRDLPMAVAWGLDDNVRIGVAEGRHPVFLEVTYPKGSYAPSAEDAPRGGAGFYVKLKGAERVERACLRYAVRFPDDFLFAKGGKLPGLFGGAAPAGGEDVTGKNGFSIRFMWRELGAGEVYAYVVNKPGEFGLSIGRGSWRFPPEEWVTLEQEVVLNDPASANGLLRVWVDGLLVIEQTDIAYRSVERVRIDGLMFSTFFGGNDESWASPKDQEIRLADFEIFLPEAP